MTFIFFIDIKFNCKGIKNSQINNFNEKNSTG